MNEGSARSGAEGTEDIGRHCEHRERPGCEGLPSHSDTSILRFHTSPLHLLSLLDPSSNDSASVWSEQMPFDCLLLPRLCRRLLWFMVVVHVIERLAIMRHSGRVFARHVQSSHE